MMKMEDAKIINFPEMKIVDDDFEVDFGIELGVADIKNSKNDIIAGEISERLEEVNGALDLNYKRLSELNNEITRLSNSSDGIDYMVAVGSGLLAGLVDSFWVGQFSLERSKEWGSEKVNNFVKKIAENQGYKGDDLKGAIEHLENEYHLAGDGGKVKDAFGGGQHHLRDFRHHPTVIGLVFSLLTQFTGKAYGTDTTGAFLVLDIEERDKFLIGKDVREKLSFGVIDWFFHIVSDMAGTSTNPGAGTGLPGPILSLLKELSSLPFFNSLDENGNKEFSVWISKLFNGTLLAERDENGKIIKETVQRFDLRTEIGVMHELGCQALPVILNECIVRSFYFIRRLVVEIKKKDIKQINELKRIDWHKVKPTNNRTIVRMLTIATGTFTLVDVADAAIRGSIKSGGNTAVFAKEFLLRVNFIGVGRFAIAVGTDAAMGMKREKLRNERISIFSEQLHLMNAKVYYMQADAWIAAEQTEKTINEAIEIMQQTSVIFLESWRGNRNSMERIGECRKKIEEKNAGLIDDISETLKWG